MTIYPMERTVAQTALARQRTACLRPHFLAPAGDGR